MPVDSLKKRYSFKLGGNIIGFILSFLTAGIVPRSLGVSDYGNYGYLTNFFTQVIAFFDFKTSTCFYIKKSQDQEDRKLVRFYFIIIILIFLSAILSTLLFTTPLIKQFLFKNQFIRWMYFACILAFFVWLTDVFTSMMDALGKTVYVEKIRIFTKVVGVILLILLFYLNKLTLDTYFIFQILILVLFIASVTFFINKNNTIGFSDGGISKKEFIDYAKVFYVYSYPLFGYMALQLISNLFDRWILQKYCGSHEQGLYSLSFSLMQVMFLFVNAIYPLLTREISIAAGNNKFSEISEIFNKYYPLLFAVVAYFCSFIFVNSKIIIQFFGGNAFGASQMSMKILMLYPLISAFSGLNSSIVYSTDRTKIFLILSLIFTPLGIIMDIALINPSFLNLGASGLAIKVVITEFISLIIILILNSKIIKLDVKKYILHFLFAGIFLIIAFFSYFVSQIFFLNNILRFIASGLIYSIFIIFVGWFSPRLLGLNNEFQKLVSMLLSKLKRA